jgi:ribonuclease Z
MESSALRFVQYSLVAYVYEGDTSSESVSHSRGGLHRRVLGARPGLFSVSLGLIRAVAWPRPPPGRHAKRPGRMLLTVKAGPYSIRGLSIGGVHTTLHVPELDALFDVGLAPRSFAGVDNVFLSHGHADHSGALMGLLGLRGLSRRPPPRVFLPQEIQAPLEQATALYSQLQRYELRIDAQPLKAGDELKLKGDLWLRAFRTHHTVPSLGYQFFTRVQKLRPEHLGLPGAEIARLRRAGADLFESLERLELAYATDTLIRVLDTSPSLLKTRVLILECSFLDEKKELSASRAGCHIHLDELLERADSFENEALVLMHFSQLYMPAEVHSILRRRCPPRLFERVVVFAPTSGPWPG